MPQPHSSNASTGHMTLSEEDVNRLLTDKTADTRVNMTGRIGSTYTGAALDARETKVAEQIFRLLMRDTEIRVRATLAQHVKDSGAIPHDIVLKLARDVEEVSLPILQFSEVLTDEDLVELIQSTEEVTRYLAISQRKSVSPAVTDTLINKGNDAVTSTLVNNTGAAISENNLNKIVETYAKDESMMQAMSKRPQMPVATVEKMISVVSASLASSLKQKFHAPEHIEREVEKTRETETLHLVRATLGEADIDRLITQLIAANRLNPSLILSALCQGNFEFFETALARLSGIPISNARKLITDQGELGFRAIYNKSGLPDAMFPAVKLLLKIVRDLSGEGEKAGSPRYANRIVERILQHSEEKHMENLSYIIALVRRVAQ